MPSHFLFPPLFSCAKWVLLIWLVVPSISSAQSRDAAQQEPRTSLGPTSHPVMLDVIVRDKSGKSVSNLKRDDFTVEDEDNKQIIAGFERPDQHRFTIATTSSDPKHGERSDRNVAPALTILVVDCMNMDSHTISLVQEMIMKYLRTHAPRLPQPTALVVVTHSQLELVHDYTEDAAELEQAILREDAAFSLGQGEARTVGGMERVGITQNYLEQIAAANMNFAGRKNLVWIGSGLPAIDLIQTRGLRSGSMPGPGPDLERFIENISTTANDIWKARLAIYTIDPHGLQSHSAAAGLAPQTGGRNFFSRNDLDVAIANSVDDGADYYTLSYYPSNGNWDGKFRAIKVTLADPNLTARTRTGYYATPDTPATEDVIDAELTKAITNPFPYRGLGLTVSYKIVGGTPRMARYTIAIDRHDVGWQPTPEGERRCTITVVAKTVAHTDRIASDNIKALEGRVKEDRFDKEIDKPMIFSFTGEFPSDNARLRVVVRDARTGNIGTADFNMGEIAAKGKGR